MLNICPPGTFILEMTILVHDSVADDMASNCVTVQLDCTLEYRGESPSRESPSTRPAWRTVNTRQKAISLQDDNRFWARPKTLNPTNEELGSHRELEREE
jgi:hypothetical protein